MIIYHRTSLLESQAQTVVNTVNCVGVMGKGIAAEFKRRYPKMFKRYRDLCEQGLLEPGKLWLFKGADQWVLNFPTKVDWRNASQIEWIEAGLEKFVSTYEERGIQEIAFPRLGCGNGGLDWNDVRPVMEKYLRELSIQVYIHDYQVDIDTPEHVFIISEAETIENFADFLFIFKRLVKSNNGKWVNSYLKKEFHIKAIGDDEFEISDHNSPETIASEDIREIWSNLLVGPLTRDKIPTSQEENASHLMQVLTGMPSVRQVEIRRDLSDKSELALELRKRGASPVGELGGVKR